VLFRSHPLGLAYWGQSWTLTAWCEMRNGFRNFRLDRIEGLQITFERFDQVPGHTLADFLALMAAEEHATKNVQSHAAK
jgi:predicted DNA-binding transcriptional regulator YafY